MRLCDECLPERTQDGGCSCSGCWACSGHVPDCTCDIAWDCEHEPRAEVVLPPAAWPGGVKL